MKILGISSFYHDSAAAIIVDGEIIAAAQEERFTRVKHDASFPKNAVEYCLKECATSIDELDAIVFYDKPLLKFERLLETYYSFAPKGFLSFLKAIPVWLKEKLFLKRLIYEELKEIQDFDKKKLRLLFPEHHLSHAASSFYPSPFEEAAILTVDGVGEWATASIYHGKGRSIKKLKEMHFPHSVGLLYSAFTYFLGFRVNSGEYKLMGLAPYGNPDSEKVKEFIEKIKTKLIRIYEDGSIWMDMEYFTFATGLRMVNHTKWAELFGFQRRESESKLEQHHCDLAMAIQAVTEEVVLKMAKHAKELTQCKNLCLSGGVALNCVANGKLSESGLFDEIYIQPASGDAGGALGGALAAYHMYFEKDRTVKEVDSMRSSLLGPEATNSEVEELLKKFSAKSTKLKNENLYEQIAQHINNGKVIGFMQGRMEFGPRALGARSIIADPRNREMQKKLNLKIKFRESFRPFAPSVLKEDAQQYFQLEQDSPYMLLVHEISDSIKKEIPDNYHQMEVKEKLYVERSSLPAITHIDFSARIQTVNKESNPSYYELIKAFKELSGCPVVVNTSFNVRGEPIVCTAEDAYTCFMRTQMDVLVINDHLFIKEEQPEWEEEVNWKESYVLD